MKRVEKNKQIRTKIIEAARTLFIQQSYSNTTIRQILKKTVLQQEVYIIFSKIKRAFSGRLQKIT
jgi:hypothetical protein